MTRAVLTYTPGQTSLIKLFFNVYTFKPFLESIYLYFENVKFDISLYINNILLPKAANQLNGNENGFACFNGLDNWKIDEVSAHPAAGQPSVPCWVT